MGETGSGESFGFFLYGKLSIFSIVYTEREKVV